MKLASKRKWFQVYLGLMNHPATPGKVARGVAIGLCCAFVVPVFQMALAFVLAVLFKGARFSALLFTWISNPFTIPLIYPLQYFVGGHLVGQPVSYEVASRSLAGMLAKPSLPAFAGLGRELLVPFFVGGLFLGLVVAVVGYFLSKAVIIRFRARKSRRIMQRREWMERLRLKRKEKAG